MAIRSTSDADYLKRTTNVVQPTSPYTAIFWARYTGVPTIGPYRTVWFSALDPVTTYVPWTGIFTNANSVAGDWDYEAGDPSTVSSPHSFIVNLWYPIAVTRSGTTFSYYVAGVFISSFTLSFSGTFDWLSLLTDTFGGGTQALEIYNFREWNVALNLTQINAEINSPSAVVNSSGLVTYTPLTSDLLDLSGNGNNWTAVGSPTFVADPQFFIPGTLFIPDENAANGGCLISSADGSFVQNPVNIVQSNEGGASLNDGRFILADINALSGGAGPFKIFNKEFILLATTANFAYSDRCPMTSDGSAFFYANTSNFPPIVAKIDAATGATIFSDNVGQSGTLDEVYSLAVNSTGTILYYFDAGSGLVCYQWDLVNHVALPNLFTIPAGGAIWGRDLILTNDSIFSLISIDSSFTNYSYNQFNSTTGASILTIGLGTDISNGDIPRLSQDLGGPGAAVWMRTFPNNPITTSTFTQIRLSDGGTITTFTIATGRTGGIVDPTKAPDSCPFFAWSDNLTATIIVGKASVPVNNETFTMTVTGPTPSTFTIGFQGTQQLDVAPGIYSIVETPDANYNPQYNVSNGNPNTAINIGLTQLIDVVIVNQLSAKYGGLYQLVPGKTNDTLRNQDGSTTDKIINWFFELFTDRDK